MRTHPPPVIAALMLLGGGCVGSPFDAAQSRDMGFGFECADLAFCPPLRPAPYDGSELSMYYQSGSRLKARHAQTDDGTALPISGWYDSGPPFE